MFETDTGCLSSQRYNFLKANHNQWSMAMPCFSVVYQVKDTIFWKQITTCRFKGYLQPTLFIKSKIQFFESKSQPITLASPVGVCCLSSQRYNFLKANHNELYPFCIVCRVVYQVKDTIFWKQITTWNYRLPYRNCCLSSQRYNFLKANHN